MFKAAAPKGVEWEAIKAQFGVGQPARRRWEILCEENRELLEGYWQLLLQLGRLPEPEEFPRFAELRERVGSGKRALRLFVLAGAETRSGRRLKAESATFWFMWLSRI